MKQVLATTMLALMPFAVQAQTTVVDAWVRGTVAQQRATGLFAQITSVKGGRLVAVTTPAAGMAEIHQMTMEDNVMRMRDMPDGLLLPPGKAVQLKPGGFHIMLMGLKNNLQPGDKVPVTLVIESNDKGKETVAFTATVRGLDGVAAAPSAGEAKPASSRPSGSKP